MPGYLAGKKGFYPEIPRIIEDERVGPPREEADYTEKPIGGEDSPLISKAEKSGLWFASFIDGTYRIARTYNCCGVPLYIASINSILTKRTEEKRLKEIGLGKNLIVILFPFDAFCKRYHNDKELCNTIIGFQDYIKKEYNAISDRELRGNTAEILGTRPGKNIWLYSDITYTGFKGKNTDINPENIFDEGKIYSRVRSRVRVLMAILESADLNYYRKTFETRKYKTDSESWVLIDGTLNNYWKFFSSKANQSDEYPIFNKTVGFVKNIRRNPKVDPLILYKLKPKEYVISYATKNDEEYLVRYESGEDDLEGDNRWGFLYFRFRKPVGYAPDVITSKGLVKLQFRVTDECSITEKEKKEEAIINKAKIISALCAKERFPIPCDMYRLWNEAVVIEETEHIAKSRLLSKEWLINKGWSL